MSDPQMSDQDLARINAAAVTREYRVQPHLGASTREFRTLPLVLTVPRLQDRVRHQRVCDFSPSF